MDFEPGKSFLEITATEPMIRMAVGDVEGHEALGGDRLFDPVGQFDALFFGNAGSSEYSLPLSMDERRCIRLPFAYHRPLCVYKIDWRSEANVGSELGRHGVRLGIDGLEEEARETVVWLMFLEDKFRWATHFSILKMD
jgi:hypothetical protein